MRIGGFLVGFGANEGELARLGRRNDLAGAIVQALAPLQGDQLSSDCYPQLPDEMPKAARSLRPRRRLLAAILLFGQAKQQARLLGLLRNTGLTDALCPLDILLRICLERRLGRGLRSEFLLTLGEGTTDIAGRRRAKFGRQVLVGLGQLGEPVSRLLAVGIVQFGSFAGFEHARRTERDDRRTRDEQRGDRAANHEGALVETADRPRPRPQLQPFRWHLVGILRHDAPPVLKICETGRASVRMIRTVRWGFSPRRSSAAPNIRSTM